MRHFETENMIILYKLAILAAPSGNSGVVLPVHGEYILDQDLGVNGCTFCSKPPFPSITGDHIKLIHIAIE